MLAYTIKDLDKLEFPLMASPKIDGVRCVIKDGGAISRTLKPIPNHFIRDCLKIDSNVILDGELVCGNFQETVSAIMSRDGTPDFKYIIFDYYSEDNEDFTTRMEKLSSMELPERCILIVQTIIHNVTELIEYYHKCLKDGYEGIVTRKMYSKYKFGRSTEREGILGKLKPWIDEDFKIVGYEPLRKNLNESILDNLGHKIKKQDKDNQEKMELLGALICMTDGGVLSVGSGFTMAQREELWKVRDELIGQYIKVKHFNYGKKDLPRQGTFLGIRPNLDI